MDLINEFKEKILCSKQLLEKCKLFQKFERRHLDKGLDDFSCHITDSINLDLLIEEGNQTISCEEIEENMNEYTYFNIIKNVLDSLTINIQLRNYLALIGIEIKYQLVCYFKFDVKYFFDKNQFALKNITSCEILKITSYSGKGYEIFAIESDGDLQYKNLRNKKIILGYSKSEENAKKIINLLLEEKKYLLELDKKIKEDLFEIIQIINSDKYRILENDSESFQLSLKKLNELLQENYSSYEELNKLKIEFVINKWLDKNCKIHLRDLLNYNKYNHYCSLSDYWLNFVWFLQDNAIINLVKV